MHYMRMRVVMSPTHFIYFPRAVNLQLSSECVYVTMIMVNVMVNLKYKLLWTLVCL